MDTYTAMKLGQAATEAGNKFKIFDWKLAASLIQSEKPVVAIAGLLGDWGSTSAAIWENNAPVFDSWAFLTSNWATPALSLTLQDGTEIEYECWKYGGTDPSDIDDSHWPKEALLVLGIIRPEPKILSASNEQ